MLDLLKPLLQQSRSQKRGRKAKPKPVFVSRAIELQYAKELLAISAMCQEEANQLVIPQVSKHVGDAWFSDAVKALKDKISGAVDSIADKLATKTVNEQKKQADAQLALQLEKLTGIDLRGLFRDEDLKQAVDEAIAANTALIKSIPSQYSEQVQAAILRGLQEGKRAADIKKDIAAIGQSTDSRALLIARDQLGKINSRINQIRQQKLGITHYYWSTSHDEKVRHSHRLRDGKIFAWDNPPSDGHAGQAIRCRCTPIPYLDHLIDPDAPTPEQAILDQQAVTGQHDAFKSFNLVAKQAGERKHFSTNSERLLDGLSEGLFRDDLPYYADKVWGGGDAGLRKSRQLYNQLLKDGIDPPDSWAVHHWSIQSKYASEILRGKLNLNIKADLRAEFADISQQALIRLNDVFAHADNLVKQNTAVYRGEGASPSLIAEIEASLKDGFAYAVTDKSYLSHTTAPELAHEFALRNAKDGRIPVIHQTIFYPGVRAVDITPYHYYPDNEVLLDRGFTREIIAMRRRDDGVIEMVTEVKPMQSHKVGDSSYHDQMIAEGWTLHEAHYDDPRDEAMSGYVMYGRRGRKLTD